MLLGKIFYFASSMMSFPEVVLPWYVLSHRLAQTLANMARSTKTPKPSTLPSESPLLPSSKKPTLSSTSPLDPSLPTNLSRKPENCLLSTHFQTTLDKLLLKSLSIFTLGSRRLLLNYQKMAKREWCCLMLRTTLSLCWLAPKACMPMSQGSLVGLFRSSTIPG